MKVLVIGSGGREHALAWKLAQSPKLQCVYVAPGNGGTARDARLENVAIGDPLALAEFATKEKVTLTVVGPEAPLAAGKGVVVATTLAEAHEAIDFMLQGNRLGVQHNEGGARVVIEECLTGEEASFIVMVDGEHVLALATSQDHKRLLDGDAGPNTGGMGAYSPAPVVTPNLHARVMKEIIQPAVQGMYRDGIPFTGFLYAGLMIGADGQPKTLEFNTRLGDPETQPIMMRLKSDLFDVLMHATDGTLDEVELQWDRRFALGVVMAAQGYPLAPRKGDAVTGLPADTEDAVVFHAGTAMQEGRLVTNGGRVLCVTALGATAKGAQQRAYAAVEGIRFDGAQFRRDIGHRAIRR
jgi:phosphoribosylamine--glycine ligase